MATTRQVIALAGVGNLGRYICEELLASPHFDVVVLTRGESTKEHRDWFTARSIPLHSTDYSQASILGILTTTAATALISLLPLTTPLAVTIHAALLAACTLSPHCKRLIPSEWIGDVAAFPTHPAFYAATRAPVRRLLRRQAAVEWTLVEIGWVMDYFLPAGKSYMPPLPGEFPVDVSREGWGVCVRGTGDEAQSWTCGREVGRSVVALLGAERGQWEPVTYIASEWSTFNEAVRVLETFYDRPMTRTYKSLEQIQSNLLKYADGEDATAFVVSQIDDWMVSGASAVPREETLRQREKYFSGVEFSGLQRLLEMAAERDFV